MTITLNALQKQRRDTASNWTSNNTVLLAGELGYETDTKKFKIGDGSTAWQSLDYIPIPDTNRLLTGNLTVGGNFTVNGTTTTIDTTTLTVEDKNIEIGKVSTPTDTTADGGGITLKGATDKTINWVDSTDSWTLSEHLDLASGKVFKINNTEILSATGLGSTVVSSSLTSVGTITTGTWNATAISGSKVDPNFGSQDITASDLILTGTGTNTDNSLDLSYNATSGVASINADSSGGNTELQLGTSNNGSLGTKLTIKNTGEIGIGTTSPGADLTVRDTATHTAYASVAPSNTDCMLQLYNNPSSETTNNHASIQFGVNGGSHNRVSTISAIAESAGNRKLALGFCTDSGSNRNERMRLTGDGKLALGITSPDHHFSVQAANSAIPRIGITNPDHDENFNISTYHDSNGIYALIGCNLKYDANGNNAVDTTAHKSSGLHIDARGGGMQFLAGDAGETPQEVMRIHSNKKLLIGTSSDNSSSDTNAKLQVFTPTAGKILIGRTDNVVGINDILGIIDFHDTAGTSSNICARIAAVAAGDHDTNDKPTNLIFKTCNDASGTAVEHMRLEFDGDLRLSSSDSNVNYGFIDGWTGTTGDMVIGSDQGATGSGAIKSNLILRTRQGERMRIDHLGRVLIGIDSPRTYEQPEPFGGNDTVPALQLEGAGDSHGIHRVFAHTYNNNDVYAPTHIFGKTRGASTGSVNIVNNGDPLGIISFQGADGVDLEEAAQIRAEVDGTPGSNDMPGRLLFSTTADGGHSPITRMTIDSSGSVGIGTSSATHALDVRGSNNTTFDHVGTLHLIGEDAYNSGNAGAGITFTGKYNANGNATTLAQISGIKETTGNDEFDGALTFGTRSDASGQGVNIERMRLNSSGNLGIGTTSPATNLHIGASGGDDVNSIRIDGTNNTSGGQVHRFVIENQGDSALVNFKTSAANADETTKLTIKSISGNVGINQTNPNLARLHVVGDNTDGDIVAKFKSGAGAADTKTFIALVSGYSDTSNDLEGHAYIGCQRAGSGNTSRLLFQTYGGGSSLSTRMTISEGGNIGAPSGTNIYNASDERLKKNVVDIEKGLSAINALRPVSFNWIDGFCDEEKETLYGFIAQEVQAVDTNLIQNFSEELTVKDNTINDVLRVNEKFIIPMLVKAVQELSAKVASLEAA